MTKNKHQPDSASRRNFIRHSSLGFMLLAMGNPASLIESANAKPGATGHRPSFMLTPEDRVFFAALLPVVIHDPLLRQPEILDQYIDNIDRYLTTLSPVNQQEFQDLLSILHSPAKGMMTGIWKDWDKAAPYQIKRFLKRWRTSSLSLLRKAYSGLLNLALMKWYDMPVAWAAIHYPGPPYQQQLITPPNQY